MRNLSIVALIALLLPSFLFAQSTVVTNVKKVVPKTSKKPHLKILAPKIRQRHMMLEIHVKNDGPINIHNRPLKIKYEIRQRRVGDTIAVGQATLNRNTIRKGQSKKLLAMKLRNEKELLLAKSVWISIEIDDESTRPRTIGRGKFHHTFEVAALPINLTEAWGGHLPRSFGTNVYRVKWPKKLTKWRTGGHFGFWAASDNTVDSRKRKLMYVTEFWGPNGSGSYVNKNNDHVHYYPDGRGRPNPINIKNIFMFFSGNSGMGTASIATGQTDRKPFKGTGVEKRRCTVRKDSWPGQLAMQQKLYPNLYGKSNTLMGMGFQTQFQAATAKDELTKIARGFFRWMKSGSANFKNVKVIYIGGASRGGALSIRIAKMIKSAIAKGEIRPPADMKLIVTATDAVSTRRDQLSYVGRAYLYNRASDGNKHNFEEIFPANKDGGVWVRNLWVKQTVGSARGFDSMVHGGYKTYADGLAGNFYTQNFIDRKHSYMCCDWGPKNGLENLAFFFKKAWAITDFKQHGI